MTFPSPGLCICGGPGTRYAHRHSILFIASQTHPDMESFTYSFCWSCAVKMKVWAKNSGYNTPTFCLINMASNQAVASNSKGGIMRALFMKLARVLEIGKESSFSVFEKHFKKRVVVLVLHEIDMLLTLLPPILVRLSPGRTSAPCCQPQSRHLQKKCMSCARLWSTSSTATSHFGATKPWVSAHPAANNNKLFAYDGELIQVQGQGSSVEIPNQWFNLAGQAVRKNQCPSDEEWKDALFTLEQVTCVSKRKGCGPMEVFKFDTSIAHKKPIDEMLQCVASVQ